MRSGTRLRGNWRGSAELCVVVVLIAPRVFKNDVKGGRSAVVMGHCAGRTELERMRRSREFRVGVNIGLTVLIRHHAVQPQAFYAHVILSKHTNVATRHTLALQIQRRGRGDGHLHRKSLHVVWRAEQPISSTGTQTRVQSCTGLSSIACISIGWQRGVSSCSPNPLEKRFALVIFSLFFLFERRTTSRNEQSK